VTDSLPHDTSDAPPLADPAKEAAASDAHRPLTPAERYRALDDAFDFQQDLVDLGDHKARFALVIMFGLNAVAFLLLVRGDLISGLPALGRTLLAVYFALYGAVAVYFFFQAIEALRPRMIGATQDRSLPALRFFDGILGRAPREYARAWAELRQEQLCDEMAEQIHALSRVNRQKYLALQRLYFGLQVMTVMTALPILVLELGSLL
jgi:hypothetical protein